MEVQVLSQKHLNVLETLKKGEHMAQEAQDGFLGIKLNE